MIAFTKFACALLLTGGLAGVALAAEGDAGSGPTKGATSTNDAGSGPTKGADANSANNANHDQTNNRPDTTPGPKSTGGSQPVTPGGTTKP